MSCSRGKANPDATTQRRLFAASGGYCQNPSCNRPLFVETDKSNISIAEMAHIFAAQDYGPRADRGMTEVMRGAYGNLILLCPVCHTIVDKAPGDFPDSKIMKWKDEHERRIASVFGAVSYETRYEVHEALKALTARTSSIHRRIGPQNEYSWNPEADEAAEWQHQVRHTIIPTNRSILALIDRNRNLLQKSEIGIAELFRQHIEGMERRHIFFNPLPSAPRYPPGVDSLFHP